MGAAWLATTARTCAILRHREARVPEITMRNLLWVSALVVAASCGGGTTSGKSAAGNQPAGAGNDAKVTADPTAAAGGASAIDPNSPDRVVTGRDNDSGAGGASATSGSGGHSEHDAGQRDAGHADHDAGHDAGHGGAGGRAGTGGSPSTECDQLKSDYAAALQLAQMCDPSASAQCQQQALRNLGCYCTTTVNDTATLDDIKARYDQAGCPPEPGCRGIFCTSPGTGKCMSIDSGDVCN